MRIGRRPVARKVIGFKSMRVPFKLLLLLAALGGAGYGGWLWWDVRGETRVVLPTQPAATGSVENNVSALGTVNPANYVDVGTQVSGQLQVIRVEIGDKVNQGDLLAEIDPTVYQSRVNASEAQLMVLQAQMADKRAQRTLAEQQLKRQRELLAVRATSQDAHDIAVATVQQIVAQIAALEAQAKQTQSTLAGDQANLRYTKIYAPMTGTVVSITAKRGGTLNANQTAPIILRIADLDTMTVSAQVSEADIPKLKPGMPVYFTTLGRPERRWNSTLRQILPTPDVVNNVVLYNAQFDVANTGQELLPQMSAQVFFVIASARNVTTVPVGALRRLPVPGRPANADAPTGPEAGAAPRQRDDRAGAPSEPNYMVRVMEDGRPVERPVSIGVMNRLLAEVRSGLAPGEEVVVDAAPDQRRPQGGAGFGGPGLGGGLTAPRR